MNKKRCPKCKTHYSWTVEDVPPFNRDRSKKDGLDHRCKKCKTKEGRLNREEHAFKNTYVKIKHKHSARLHARKKWGDAIKVGVLNCAVLGCGKKCSDLHHYDYEDPECVVPLCRAHHDIFHTNWIEKIPESAAPILAKEVQRLAPEVMRLESEIAFSEGSLEAANEELEEKDAEIARLREALDEMLSVYDLIQKQKDSRQMLANIVYGFFEGDGTVKRAREALGVKSDE